MLALVSLGLFALGVGLSLLAAYLLRPKMKPQEQPPTSLAIRGAYVPWIIGRRRIKPVFGWAGGRHRKRERMGKGKGGSLFSPKVKIYYEEGWHLLAIGPCTALYKIYVGNKAIFDGKITPDTHPSGTTYSLGKEGTFTIYWGELDQPVNTILGDESRVGVNSRWPGICYIHWNEKRLGEAPVWPMLEYVIERQPTGNYLTQSYPWHHQSYEFEGTEKRWLSHTVAGQEGIGYLFVRHVVHAEFEVGKKVRVTDSTTVPDGDYDIIKVSEVIDTYNSLAAMVYIAGGVPGSGTVEQPSIARAQSSQRPQDIGANPAHVIADLLFEDWPYGLGLKQDDWDMDSLEELGIALQQEDWWTSWEASNARSAKELLGMALQDLGALIYWDSEVGKHRIRLLRKAEGTLFEVSKNMLLPPEPEIESVVDSIKATRVVYTYKDVNMAYRQMTIAIDDDGQAAFLNYQNAQQTPIEIADHFDVAAKIAERRSQEELGNGAKMKLNVDRSCRMLTPGQPITIEGYEEVYRVLGLQIFSDTNRIELQVMADFYGAEPSTFENRPGKDVTEDEATKSNPLVTFLEIPEFIKGASRDLSILAPVVRANYVTFDEMLYLSEDGSTYTIFGDQGDFAVGGELIDALPEGGKFMLDEGPTFTVKGPDISAVQDLSGDETSWRRGRQLCVIGNEICFLKKVTAMGGDTYRLDGLIRARYDTRREAHAVGDGIFIFANTDFSEIKDILLEAGKDLYLKAQPIGFNGELPVDLVVPVQKTLYGKGLVPMSPEGLRVSAPVKQVSAYSSGQDISFKWNYLSTLNVASGAGMQGYGVPCSESPVDGTFKLEILDSTNNVKRTVADLTDNSYTYTNANLVSDFGSEPASFKVRVYAVRGGLTSNYTELEVEKL